MREILIQKPMKSLMVQVGIHSKSSDKLKNTRNYHAGFAKQLGIHTLSAKSGRKLANLSKPEKAGMGHLVTRVTNDNVKMCDKLSKCVSE